jgi:hypothetical protein
MKGLFLHGWQSVPGGVKPTFLAQHCHEHEVVNPKLPDDDFHGAVEIAQAEFDKHQPAVVVGSSRGDVRPRRQDDIPGNARGQDKNSAQAVGWVGNGS